MPIWFHSLTILPGSAAGAAALKYDWFCFVNKETIRTMHICDPLSTCSILFIGSNYLGV